jgi:glucokinase
MDLPIVLGADIGGSHISSALINMHTRSIIPGTEQRAAVNAKGSAEAIVQEWAAVLRKSACRMDLAHLKIGIAMPGPFDYGQGICLMKGNEKYEALYGINVKALLASAMGLPAQHIRMNNDAGCFLKGELFASAGLGFPRAIGITLGTGLGTSSFDGMNAVDANLWCSPFKDNIAEDYLCTRWFVRRFQQLSGIAVTNVKELVDNHGSNACTSMVFDEFTGNLVDFLSDFIAAEQPEVIVLGGNIMKCQHLFLPQLKNRLYARFGNLRIVPSTLGEHAAMLGAGSLFG